MQLANHAKCSQMLGININRLVTPILFWEGACRIMKKSKPFHTTAVLDTLKTEQLLPTGHKTTELLCTGPDINYILHIRPTSRTVVYRPHLSSSSTCLHVLLISIQFNFVICTRDSVTLQWKSYSASPPATLPNREFKKM